MVTEGGDKNEKAEKEKKIAALPKTFLDFILLAFDDLEDTLGWTTATVSLYRVILVAFITVVQSRSASLKSDYDNKAWPSVFDLMVCNSSSLPFVLFLGLLTVLASYCHRHHHTTARDRIVLVLLSRRSQQ